MIRDGQLRTAKSSRGGSSAWVRPLKRSPISCSEPEKKRAGEFYRSIALMEHASIAAFHHFALELMTFGAPPHLLAQTQQAIADEIRHAQSAFSIASSLLGETVSPAGMDIDVSLADNLCVLAERVAREAAINETLAVIVASHQLTKVTDPTIFAYLRDVVQDETRHAELAWETLRWCIQVGGDPVREVLRSISEQPLSVGASEFPMLGIESLGVLSQQQVQKILRDGFDSVVRPAFDSLLRA